MRGSMEKQENAFEEFLGVVCNLYIIAILAAVPLYTGGSYYLIGDSKYILFRNVSVLCLGIWLCLSLVQVFAGFLRRGLGQEGDGKIFFPGNRFSTVDIAMLSYGGCVLVSALHSAYGRTAWLGYQDWYMGAVSQLIFVGIYFFVSRCYGGGGLPVYLGEAAILAVAALGFANRLAWDPLGLFREYLRWDWEYSHMLSTVGNINWLSGYLGVMLAFPLAGFLNAGSRGKCVFTFLVSVSGLSLLVLQGSDMGIGLAAAALFLGLAFGYIPLYRKHLRKFGERVVLLAASVSLCIGIMGRLICYRETLQAMPPDSFLQGRLDWYGWWAGALILFFLYGICKALPHRIFRKMLSALILGGAVAAAALLLRYLHRQPFDSRWGSDRGGIWAAAWKGFWRADWIQKCIGAGPDCFAEYIYTLISVQSVSHKEGHWRGSVYANAHNEWLTMLVNVGILGTAAFMGIIISAVRRYRGMLLGIFVTALYVLNSMASFQQVLNAPILFVALGMCEHRLRRAESGSSDVFL